MTFQDMFKKTFFEQFQLESSIGIDDICFALLFSVLAALYVFFLYKFLIRKNMYNLNMNLSIVGMTILTTAIIITIQSNLVLSLGMVGALSIVRYRTAVKDPMDLFFMFWAVANGIMCGARQYLLAIVVTVIVTVIVFVLSQIPSKKAPYVLVVNGKKEELEKNLLVKLDEHCAYYKVKARNMSKNDERIIIELRVNNAESLLNGINKIEGVTSVSLLTYEGDIVA